MLSLFMHVHMIFKLALVCFLLAGLLDYRKISLTLITMAIRAGSVLRYCPQALISYPLI